MPAVKMFIQNHSNKFPVYKPVSNNNNTFRTIPRLAIGGAMIGRIQFSKSGCSSCGK
jgi:hypothetical protein